AREPLRLPVEDARDERGAAVVVVEDPGGEPDRRVLDPVQRLRALRHLLGVREAVLVEEGELLVRVLLVGREPGRRRLSREGRPRRPGADPAPAMLGWMPGSPGAAPAPIRPTIPAPQPPPCAT